MNDLFMQGLELIVLGMGFVFVFLILLVYLMHFMSYIINNFFAEPLAVTPNPQTLKNLTKNQNENEELLVAMSVASIHHKRIKGDK